MTFDQNNLSTLNYRFKLDRTPNLEYKVQRLSLPDLSLGTARVPSPFVTIPEPGNLTYGSLQLTFLVGENMRDYLEIFNWMVALGKPDTFNQYRDWRSDCSVFILNSNLNANISVRFTDAYPVSLSGIDFDTTLTETQYATASATFEFTRWYVESINS